MITDSMGSGWLLPSNMADPLMCEHRFDMVFKFDRVFNTCSADAAQDSLLPPLNAHYYLGRYCGRLVGTTVYRLSQTSVDLAIQSSMQECKVRLLDVP